MKIRYDQAPAGRSPVEDVLLGLPEETRLEVADALLLLESGQSISKPLSRSLAGIRPGLHELWFRDKAGQVRVMYYLKKGEAIYLVHAFRKKIQTIPRRDLDIILKDTEGDMTMAWKEVTVEELAKSLGANVAEVREKQRLVKLIVKTRKEQELSQAALAKKLGISQARIAQIESGVGTAKVTFDVLFNMLVALGFDYKVVTRKAA
jgi:phage-related protein/DNA-binding XRE family transcriptional regulator